jgi:hydroxypyruvate reductase
VALSLVDEVALFEALQTHQISGAALDTFVDEPLIETPLTTLDNVLLTPHSAGATAYNFAFVARRAVDNTCRRPAGEALPADDLVL